MSMSRPHWRLDATDVPAPSPVTERHVVSATDRLVAIVCDADRRSDLRHHIHIQALITAGSTR